ncbi:MAG: acyl-CoA dehydrogenase family protein [Burkholderiales bacterium]
MSQQDSSEHRLMLSDSVTDFARGVDVARVRKLRETKTECDRAVWKQMADLGWLGVLVPEQYGGMGLQLGDMAIVAQGLARALVPEPLTAAAVLAARVLADSNNNPLKKKLLEGLVSGDMLPATAWQEQAGTLDVSKISAEATPFEGGFRVNGSKRFVMGASSADGYIVSANSAQGMQLLWVPRNAAGASLMFDMLADGRQSGTLTLSDVNVAKENVINTGAAASASLARAIDHTAAIVSAELCGIMGRSLEMTLDYMKTRVQFGKPIGSFQSLQHRAVDLYIQQELSSAVLADCLGVLDSEPDAKARSAAASRVKARCTDAALLITRQAIQLHGAIGYTEDCDVGLYVKRAMTLAAWLGNGNTHRRRYAKTEILEGVV